MYVDIIIHFFPRTSHVWDNLPLELKSSTNSFITAANTIDPEDNIENLF